MKLGRQGRRHADRSSARRREDAPRGTAGAIERGLQGFARLLLGGVQEIGALWIAAAERIGELELRLLRLLRGPAVAAIATTRRWLLLAQREVTPERAVAAVIVAAAVLLAASQFSDYRGVRIGAPQYDPVESVAPAPQVDRETAGHAHAYVLLPLALVSIVAAASALRGRWRIARIVSLVGFAALVVSLLIDAPKGLQEGSSGIAFEGARAVLIGGFWVQVSSAAVLVIGGLLLARYVRLASGEARSPSARRMAARRGARSPVAEVRP
jgi:hypothetical protein